MVAMKSFAIKVLMEMNQYGPIAIMLAERLGHMFGICLGVH